MLWGALLARRVKQVSSRDLTAHRRVMRAQKAFSPAHRAKAPVKVAPKGNTRIDEDKCRVTSVGAVHTSRALRARHANRAPWAISLPVPKAASATYAQRIALVQILEP